MEAHLRVFGALISLAIVTSVGCSSGDAPGMQNFEVQDSSGVEIVLSGSAIHDEGDRWRVVSDPILQIGQVEGDSPYLFQRISSAVRVPDGRIVVSDARDLDIRIFGSDGTHELSFGQSGEGPMEFGGQPFLALVPPDTLVVWDSGNYRLSRFDLTGSLLSQRSLRATLGGLSIDLGSRLSWSITPDGALLWTGPPELRTRRVTGSDPTSAA